MHGINWPTAEQEALDEINDVKILKAVQMSMTEWKLKKSLKHRYLQLFYFDINKLFFFYFILNMLDGRGLTKVFVMVILDVLKILVHLDI